MPVPLRWTTMLEVMKSTTGQMVMGLAGLLIMTMIGVYVVLKFRDDNDSSDSIENASDMITKFREMRQEGHIDEKEYRTIKTDLEKKLSKHSTAETVDSDGFDLHG